MENNAAMIVDSLLAKFGTTMDRLMPAIIDFGRYECRHTIRICIWLIIIGMIFMLLTHFGLKHDKKTDNIDLEVFMDFFFVIGALMVLVSIFMIVVALCTIQKWNDFPEMMAYKYIFGLMR